MGLEGSRSADAGQPTIASPILASLVTTASDETGRRTFERYVWQAKQAVRLWLTCLSVDGPDLVVCEHVEDIVLVHGTRVRFIQLKTRDAGSWSAAKMCDRGLDALVRSYGAARAAGIHEHASFELWVEGPLADDKATLSFARSPTDCGTAFRNRLIAYGLDPSHVDDFLARLVIQPDQPPRSHIDAKTLFELGALWQLSQGELIAIYERLLAAASAAQAGNSPPQSVQGHLAERFSTGLDAIRNQVLTADDVKQLTPPLRAESNEDLLSRMTDGQSASLLELKLLRAGASSETIKVIQEIRAEMEIERQLLLAGRDDADEGLARLAQRLLAMAVATAGKIRLVVASQPALGARPAEAITADLLSRPADLAHCDKEAVFGRDERLVFGYLAHLSDTCKFGWT
jgi:hypothetical protein